MHNSFLMNHFDFVGAAESKYVLATMKETPFQ